MDKAQWVDLPSRAKELLLKDLEEDLDKALHLLRVQDSPRELLRLQGQARYLYRKHEELKKLHDGEGKANTDGRSKQTGY